MDAKKGLAAVLDRPAPTRRQLLLGGGHLAAVWTLAFVQPLLDLLGKNPDFFVARDNTAGDILILAIGFTVLPPLALLALEFLVSRVSARAYQALHFLLLAGISTFLFVQLVSDLIEPRSAVILALALALGLLLAWATYRFAFVKNLMDILIVAPVVVLGLFVFASDTSDLIFPAESEFEVARDSGRDTPIVVVIYDELGTSDLMTKEGRIDGRRFPNFARFAATSTWYPKQSTTAFFTPRAVPGLLTGISPDADALPTDQDQPLSIFSQFSRNRPLHVLEPVTALCPRDMCPDPAGEPGQVSRLKALVQDLKYVEGRLVLPPGMAEKLPDVSSDFGDFGGDSDGGDGPVQKKRKSGRFMVKGEGKSDPELYERFIRNIPASDRGLTVMHMHLPHQVWKYDARGRQYNESPITQISQGTGRWLVDDNGIATAQARMYTQTAYADRLLGEVRRKLESMRLWDDAIVVVAADHGISFEGGGVPQRQADLRAMGEVANPPLLIKYPGQRRGVVSTKHSVTVDVVPTIARAVGVKDLYDTDGVPLQGPVPERPVTITDPNGKEYSVSVGRMVRQRDAAIRRADRRLGTGPIYTLGAAPGLLGRRVPPRPSPDGPAHLDEPYQGLDFDPGIDLIPMFITGTVDGIEATSPAEAPLIAVAVNGAIRGTGRTFPLAGQTHFGVLIDPRYLRRGKNRIGIYRLDGRGRLVLIGGN